MAEGITGTITTIVILKRGINSFITRIKTNYTNYKKYLMALKHQVFLFVFF